MELLARLANKIGNDLVHSNVIKEEDAEIYIYGINQILVSILNVSSALIIGLIFGAFLEIAVFMTAYIPLRIFAGGYHAKTPSRCYIISVIMLIIVSIGIKHLYMAEWAPYVVLAAALIVIILSPVEDKNKPLNAIERRVYKKKAILIVVAELIICVLFKLNSLDNLLISIVYSFAALSVMLLLGLIKIWNDRFDG